MSLPAFSKLESQPKAPPYTGQVHLMPWLKETKTTGITLEVQQKPAEPAGLLNIQFLRQKLSSSTLHVQESVVINPQIMHGNPVFRGTRIPLYRVIEEIADGTTLEELKDGYPTLASDQVQAGFDFIVSLLRIYND